MEHVVQGKKKKMEQGYQKKERISSNMELEEENSRRTPIAPIDLSYPD